MTSRTILLTSATVALVMALGAVDAHATTIASGFNANTVDTCDDCATGATPLGFSANFFGTTYTQTYVSNNGYVTFNSGQGTYTPTGLTASYTGQPIIASFYADVDTNDGGTVTYGTGTYAGDAAFGVTWNDVAYFAAGDKHNTFQEILVDRSDTGAGNFDIYFNYAQIQWETGSASGGSDGLGGASAAVGYANGSGGPGTYFQLPGSLVPGSFLDGGPNSLVTGTNDGTPGQFMFEVRNGAVTVPGVPAGVPEPGSWAMMILGLLGLGAVLRTRRRSAQRLDALAG